VLLNERLPRVTWIGLIVTFFGTIIVTIGEVNLSSSYFVGNMLMLLATICWAGATVASKPIMTSLTPLQLATISSWLTVPIHVLIALKGIPTALEKLSTPSFFWAVVYSGVCSTGIAYATWNAGVRMVGASHAAVFQNVVTLVAVLGGWLALGEKLMLAQIMGGVLTVAGLFLMRRGRPSSQTSSNAEPRSSSA
jgi:drug/metabolite transporter (DMT)-like permease